MRIRLPLVITSLLLLLGIFPGSANAQNCLDCRYGAYIFDSVEVQTVRFGEGVNADGQNQVLYMDVYQPFGDTVSNRPVVIFAFGGGFIQGDRHEGYVVNACKRFARAGYVSAAIDYRIGFDLLGIFPNPTHELMRVFFRAMQDMRGSVQYMRAHADSLGNSWRIDPNRIIIGGASAGAITALMVSHCDKDSEFEEIGSLSAISGLGGFYTSSGDYPGYSWEPFMTMNIAGALVNADWVEAGDPPIVSAHGDQDGTVPYQGGNFDLGFTNVGLEGSYLVNEAADSAGVCSYLYTMVGEDHPSGSMSDAELDQIFNRLMPRMQAHTLGRSYCCALSATISPAGEIPVTPGQSITLIAQISNGTGNETRLWCGVPCDIPRYGDSITVSPTPPQHYILTVFDSSCQATDFVTAYEPVGIEAPELAGGITLFPNPGNSTLTYHEDRNVQGKQLEIYDLNGRLLSSHLLTQKEMHISTANLPAGKYLIRVRGEDWQHSQIWIKQ